MIRIIQSFSGLYGTCGACRPRRFRNPTTRSNIPKPARPATQIRSLCEKMHKDACRSYIQEALSQMRFPPRITYPEHHRDSLLAMLFTLPFVVWVPECFSNRVPVCIDKVCTCVPSIREYKFRKVEDVEHKTCLLYIKYRCSGRSSKTFTTISNEYIQRIGALAMVQFPYVLTQQSGLSTAILDIIHDGIMASSGLSKARKSIERRSQNRYYSLLCIYAQRAIGECTSHTVMPTPKSFEEYMRDHALIDAKSLSGAWLTRTEMCSVLSKRMMEYASVKKVIRMDHSQKFCRHLKFYNADGSKVSSNRAECCF